MPSERVEFLSVDEVLAVHARLLERFGGPPGVRDRGLLESALYNKRVAFFATDVFLRLNGWKLDVQPDRAHRHLIGLLERGECDFARLLHWIRASIVQAGTRGRQNQPPRRPER